MPIICCRPQDALCDDCGKSGDIILKYHGYLIPEDGMRNRYFCAVCWEKRGEWYREHQEPKPLGPTQAEDDASS